MSKKITYEKNGRIYIIRPRKLKMKEWFVFLVVPSIMILMISVLCFLNSIHLNNKKTIIKYNEKALTSYTVSLKENDYYPTKVLGENMDYISNLVDKIKINYNYEIHSTETINFDYTYQIKGYLKITDKVDKNKVQFSNEYVLLETKQSKVNDNNIALNEELIIDYDKYNNIVNSFRRDYGLSSYAELDVKLEINANAEYQTEKVSLPNTFDVIIPLSEQTISITNTNKNLNNIGEINIGIKNKIKNLPLLIISIVLGITGLTLLIIAIVLYITRYNNNPYEKELRKILKENDSFIIHANNSFIEEEENLIRVESFEQLLDAQRLENKPIVFYELEKGKKSFFIIKGNENTYRFTLTLAFQLRKQKKDEDIYLKD